MNLLPSTAPNPQQTQNQNQNLNHHQQQTQIQQNTAPNPSTNDNPMHNEQINTDHEATLDWFGNEENNPLNANHGADDEFISNLAMFPMVCVYAIYIILHFFRFKFQVFSTKHQSKKLFSLFSLFLVSWLLFDYK